MNNMNNLNGKVCRVCGVFTEKEFLTKSSTSTGGFESLCKECNVQKMRNKRERYRTQGVTVSEKKCSYCDIVKSSDDFNRDRTTRDGLERQCKDCRRSRSSVYVKTIDGTRVHKVTALVDTYGAQCAYCTESFENKSLEVLSLIHI